MTPPNDSIRRHILTDHTDPGLVDEVDRMSRVQAGFERRIDQLQDHTHMIDPKEFGRMQSDVQGLRRDVDQMTGTMTQILREMREISLQMSEAKGGWRMLVMVGSVAGVAGAGIVKFLAWLSAHGPKG